MVFPVVMYGRESWTIKKGECWRIDAFELWCWRRLFRIPWTARRSNQSILKEISNEYSLEGLMLKLKLQYFGHLMRGTDSLEKTLRLGKIEGGRRRGRQRMKWLDGITDSMDMRLSELRVGDGQGGLVYCTPWGCKQSDMTETLNWLTDSNYHQEACVRQLGFYQRGGFCPKVPTWSIVTPWSGVYPVWEVSVEDSLLTHQCDWLKLCI